MQAGLVDHHALGGRYIPASSLIRYKHVMPGEIVMNRMRAAAGLFAVATSEGLVSPDYALFKAAPRIDVAYAVALFRTPALMSIFRLESRGLGTGESGFLRLYTDRFGVVPLALPPVDEQRAIVRFLDHVNQRVDMFIRGKRKLAALGNEHRAAVIRRAINVGVDTTANRRPSGIRWAPEIPSHWQITAVGTALSLLQTGPFGTQLHSHEYVYGGIPVINPMHMRAGALRPEPGVTVTEEKAKSLARHRVQPGDLVAARRGELGRCAVVPSFAEGWICGTGSLRLRCLPDVFLPEYFQLVLGSSSVADELTAASVGSTMANLNEGTVARLRVPQPPIAEQVVILEHLQGYTQMHINSQRAIDREIDLMREYRARLVADVVTGQLDVREAARSLPDPEPTVAPDLDDDAIDDDEQDPE